MERSLSKATPNTSQSALLHGQSPLAQRGYTRHLPGLFNPLLGYVALNDTPLFGARKLMGIVQVLCSSIGYRLTSMAKAQKPALYKQQRPEGPF